MSTHDTNRYGTVHCGVVMKLIDDAAGTAAPPATPTVRRSPHRSTSSSGRPLLASPLLASPVLRPPITAVLAGWVVLLGLGLTMDQPAWPGILASHLGVLVLLAAFAVANFALRAVAQRRLSQVCAVARVAQSALLREVPASVAGTADPALRLGRGRGAGGGGRAGGRLPGRPSALAHRGHARKGTAGSAPGQRRDDRLRDACAQPVLSLPEIARVVDLSVTRAAGDEDFVTTLFAEFDPRGWLEHVTCGAPAAAAANGGRRPAGPEPGRVRDAAGTAPRPEDKHVPYKRRDRLVFYTHGLLEARDRTGRFFRLEDCLDTLGRTDLNAADELLERLVAHTGAPARRRRRDPALRSGRSTSRFFRNGGTVPR